MTYLCYSLSDAASRLNLSETVLVRLSQYFQVPQTAYAEGYLASRDDLMFSEDEIRFFAFVRDRVLAGESLDSIRHSRNVRLPERENHAPSVHEAELAEVVDPAPYRKVAERAFARYKQRNQTAKQPPLFQTIVRETAPLPEAASNQPVGRLSEKPSVTSRLSAFSANAGFIRKNPTTMPSTGVPEMSMNPKADLGPYEMAEPVSLSINQPLPDAQPTLPPPNVILPSPRQQQPREPFWDDTAETAPKSARKSAGIFGDQSQQTKEASAEQLFQEMMARKSDAHDRAHLASQKSSQQSLPKGYRRSAKVFEAAGFRWEPWLQDSERDIAKRQRHDIQKSLSPKTSQPQEAPSPASVAGFSQTLQRAAQILRNKALQDAQYFGQTPPGADT